MASIESSQGRVASRSPSSAYAYAKEEARAQGSGGERTSEAREGSRGRGPRTSETLPPRSPEPGRAPRHRDPRLFGPGPRQRQGLAVPSHRMIEGDKPIVRGGLVGHVSNGPTVDRFRLGEALRQNELPRQPPGPERIQGVELDRDSAPRRPRCRPHPASGTRILGARVLRGPTAPARRLCRSAGGRSAGPSARTSPGHRSRGTPRRTRCPRRALAGRRLRLSAILPPVASARRWSPGRTSERARRGPGHTEVRG